MNKKKHKLLVSVDDDYFLLGISTDEPDYRFCWLMNDRLKTGFVRTDNLVLFNKKQQLDQEFSMFHYHDENAMLIYRLIGNTSENGHFIAELRNIDFVLHISGEIGEQHIYQLSSALNGFREVRMCVPVDPGKIRDHERLHLW